MPGKAGCKNVIELHGNVYDNFCPHCGRKYPMEYIRDSVRVPLCESCKTPVRPRVCLFGEMVDNAVITRAAEEIQKAEVLLVLVNEEPHHADRFADIVIHERVDEMLERLQRELGE